MFKSISHIKVREKSRESENTDKSDWDEIDEPEGHLIPYLPPKYSLTYIPFLKQFNNYFYCKEPSIEIQSENKE